MMSNALDKSCSTIIVNEFLLTTVTISSNICVSVVTQLYSLLNPDEVVVKILFVLIYLPAEPHAKDFTHVTIFKILFPVTSQNSNLVMRLELKELL